MRKIAVMIGSDSDLSQCVSGLRYLSEMKKRGEVRVEKVVTGSIHRNTLAVLKNLTIFSRDRLDALVVGAGMANHLTGICDAYLRYVLKDKRIVVIGVAFSNEGHSKATQAAVLSITHVPGTQVVFFDDFIGTGGFLRACKYAVERELPHIELKNPKGVAERTLKAALADAEKKKRQMRYQRRKNNKKDAEKTTNG